MDAHAVQRVRADALRVARSSGGLGDLMPSLIRAVGARREVIDEAVRALQNEGADDASRRAADLLRRALASGFFGR